MKTDRQDPTAVPQYGGSSRSNRVGDPNEPFHKTEVYKHLFSRIFKNETNPNSPLDVTEKQTLIFLATTIFHVLRKTNASKGLSDQEMEFHITRLVNQTRQGLNILDGHVPYISKAKSLAKSVIRDLEDKYGELLDRVLLDPNSRTEAFVVSCLRNNISEKFQDKTDLTTWFAGIFLGVLYVGLLLTVILIMIIGV